MPKSNCETSKQTLSKVALNEQFKEERSKDNLSKILGGNDGTEYLNAFDAAAKKLYDTKDVLGAEKMKKVFTDIYGEKSKYDADVSTVVSKIVHLVDQHPYISDFEMLTSYVYTHIPKGIRIVNKKGQLDLRTYPLSSLKNIYNEIKGMVRSMSGEDNTEVLFGSFKASLYTPKTLAKKSKGFNIMASAVRDYASEVSYDINYFMRNPEELPKDILGDAKVKRGLRDVLANVKSLVNQHGVGTDRTNANDLMMNIFSRLMRGEIFIKGEGSKRQLMIHSQYTIDRDEKGEAKRWKDKSMKYKFSVPISLKTYAPPNRKQGDWWIPIDEKDSKGNLKHDKMFDDLESLAAETRIIDNLVFKWMKKEMKASLDELFSKIKKYFPGVKGNDLRSIFFQPELKKSQAIVEGLNKEQREFYKILKDTFGPNLSDDYVIVTGGNIQANEAEFRKNHFPICTI